MADREALAAERFDQLQEQLNLPPQPHVRNINLDTHVGPNPQRPYAALENELGAITQSWASFDQLQAALPEGEANKLHEREDGSVVRFVRQHTGRSALVDGTLKHEVEIVPRNVALTRAAAQTASAQGVPTDYFNGFTWLRNGYKPERDLLVVQAVQPDRQVVWEDASPVDTAIAKASAKRVEAQQAAIPVIEERPKADARKGHKE